MKGKHVSYSPLIIKRRNPECRNGGEVKPRCVWAPSERVPFLTSRRVQPTDHGHMWASHKMLSTRKNFGLLYHCIADPYLLESAIFSSNMWEKLPSLLWLTSLPETRKQSPVCCGEFLLLTAALSGRCCLCNLSLLSHFSLPFSPRDLLCRAVDQSDMPLLCRP